jgi:non-canonical purine NTP pyrophosphatase (RdgB/HAM1 family)
MEKVTFITGNQRKADYLANYLGIAVEHIKIDLDEIQSLNLREVVKHKVRQAYAQIQKPVLVEDVSLEFKALGRLPGTFIRWFMDEMSLEKICSLLDGKDRSAIAKTCFAYFDGVEEKYFEQSLEGTIAQRPAGNSGFGGWDPIFIPTAYTVTRAEMNKEDEKKTYLQMKPSEQLKNILISKN